MVYFILCGTAAISGLGWFGYKYFKNRRNDNIDMEIETLVHNIRPINKVSVPRGWQIQSNQWRPNEIDID